MDGTVIRARQSAAGAIGGEQHEALGRSRGGFSTKIHLRAERCGKPMAFVLSGGERHESLYLGPLLNLGRMQRATVGRPRNRPGAIVGDKGYSYSTVWRMLARRGIRTVIPRRSNQRPLDRSHHFEAIRYRQRNRVERRVGRVKQYRRIATRYEKRAAHFLAMLTVAALLLWL